MKTYKDYTIDDLKQMWIDFYNKNGRYPNSIDYMDIETRNENGLPEWRQIRKALKYNCMEISEFYRSLDIKLPCNMVDITYDEAINKYKEVIQEIGRPLTVRELIKNNYGLPSSRWFLNHCPNKDIKNYNEFLNYYGFVSRCNVSKEVATQAILSKSKELGRDLFIYDFLHPDVNKQEIGMGTINKLWGSLNKMKEDLGLHINQEDMTSKKPSFQKAKEDIMNCCNIVYKDENRKVITTKDIQKYCTVKAWSYTKVFKENDTSLRDYIFSLGFQYQSSGNGLNYYFDDGERVRSQHELDFTKFLRERLNLVYGSNYFRDIKYKTFIDNYKETMDCDYIIKLENRTIYVEIIGMLKGYEKKWRNIILKSKSKTKYIKHLKLKEQMLIENNLEYYFLFPSDLQEDFLMSIFKKEAE